jgi:hypothetical protein
VDRQTLVVTRTRNRTRRWRCLLLRWRGRHDRSRRHCWRWGRSLRSCRWCSWGNQLHGGCSGRRRQTRVSRRLHRRFSWLQCRCILHRHRRLCGRRLHSRWRGRLGGRTFGECTLGEGPRPQTQHTANQHPSHALLRSKSANRIQFVVGPEHSGRSSGNQPPLAACEVILRPLHAGHGDRARRSANVCRIIVSIVHFVHHAVPRPLSECRLAREPTKPRRGQLFGRTT